MRLDLAHKSAELAGLKEEADSTAQQQSAEIARLKDAAEAAAKHVSVLEANVARQETRIASLEADLAREQAAHHLSAQMAADSELGTAQNELAVCEEKLRAKESERVALAAKLDTMEGELRESEVVRRTSEIELEIARQTVADLQARSNDFESRTRDAELQLDNFKSVQHARELASERLCADLEKRLLQQAARAGQDTDSQRRELVEQVAALARQQVAAEAY